MFRIVIFEDFDNNEDAIECLEQIIAQLREGNTSGVFPSWDTLESEEES
jgi:hypothetical protein